MLKNNKGYSPAIDGCLFQPVQRGRPNSPFQRKDIIGYGGRDEVGSGSIVLGIPSYGIPIRIFFFAISSLLCADAYSDDRDRVILT
jgi:hypothetical protein